MQKIETFTGCYSASSNAVLGNLTFQLNPLALDPRLLAASDLYMNYRFVAVTVQAFRDCSSGRYPLSLAFNTGITSNVPSTLTENMQLSVSSLGVGTFGAPWPKLLLNRKKLFQAAPKWFRRGTPYDDLLEVQGQIFLFAYGAFFDAAPVYYTIRYVVEFCNPLDAADTLRKPLQDPAFDALLARLRERDEKKGQQMVEKAETFVPKAEPDPVLEKIRDLLLRDSMVIVNQEETRNPP